MEMTFVTYPGDASTHFDRDYYVGTHLPLVLEARVPYGLETAAFFPAGDGERARAVAVSGFRDEAASRARLAADRARHGRRQDVYRAEPSPSRAALDRY